MGKARTTRTATPILFKTSRDLLDKAKRERKRLREALDQSSDLETADHAFNLSITVLSIRDWIIRDSSALEGAAHDLYRDIGGLARIADFGNASKHMGLDQDRSCYSDPPLGPATITRNSMPASPTPMWAKLTRNGGTKSDLCVDADEAIQALENFLDRHCL